MPKRSFELEVYRIGERATGRRNYYNSRSAMLRHRDVRIAARRLIGVFFPASRNTNVTSIRQRTPVRAARVSLDSDRKDSTKFTTRRQLHNVLPAAGGAASSSAQITKKTMLRSEFSLYLCIFATSVLIFPFVNLSTYRQESSADYCEKPSDNTDNYNENNCQPAANTYKKEPRYILYDVNPSEGFNLRRDVYVRAACFVKKLNEFDKQYQWNLVLPPWDKMYHWRSEKLGSQSQLPWGTFFDVRSLGLYTRVLEMYEFFREYNSSESMSYKKTVIDRVYILENDMKMFKTGNFKDKNELTRCPDKMLRFRRMKDGEFSGYFWGYANVTARDVGCLVFHGTASQLQQNLEPRTHSSFMFDRMEIPLHDSYGSQEYWRARRSMRYNKQLYELASKFRKDFLNSEDAIDNTLRPDDWTMEKPRRDAIGGEYLAVHMRRRDFLIGRAHSVPTIEGAAQQLIKILKKLELKVIFVATDAEDHEYAKLANLLKNYALHRYVPSAVVRNKFKDGGVAIIDQIICSHARYFVGTHESTFTFRIQEDREILGFPTTTTFNRLCGHENKACPRGGQWQILW